MNWFNRYTDAVYCVVRLTIGLMFACHGGQKILGFPPSERGLATNPIGLTAGWIKLSCGFNCLGLFNAARGIHRQRRNGRRLFLDFVFRENTQSRAERARAVVADPEQGRAPGAVMFYLFVGSILRPGALEH